MEIASGPLARDVYLAAIGQVVDFLRSNGIGEILVSLNCRIDRGADAEWPQLLLGFLGRTYTPRDYGDRRF